jgi:quercetin dioxygenase-like cupin family protein
MAIPHAYPGMPVDLRPEGGEFSEARTTALVKNNQFEAIRLVIPRGLEVCRDHKVDGPITFHCLQGRIAFTSGGETREVPAGHWLFLDGGVPHTVNGLEDAVVLLTVIFP